MSYLFEADHAGQMALSAPDGWQQQLPWLKALLLGLGDAMQRLEGDVLDLYTSSMLDTATGRDLDAWGALVDVQRRGLDDEEFRAYLQYRAACKRSRGWREHVLRFQEIPGITADYAEIYPAAVDVAVTYDDDPSDGAIEHLVLGLLDSLPSGVGLRAVQRGGFFRLDDPDLGLDAGPLSRRLY